MQSVCYGLCSLKNQDCGRVLRKNYRNTKQILEAASPLVEQEWNDDIAPAEAGTADLKPELSVREGTRVAKDDENAT